MSEALVAQSFTGTADGANNVVGNEVDVIISGTFVGTILVEMLQPGGSTWVPVSGASYTAPTAVRLQSAGINKWRLRCSAYTSGTIVTTMAGVIRA